MVGAALQLIQLTESEPTLVVPLTGWQIVLLVLVKACLIAALTLYISRRIRRWFERVTARTRAEAGTRLLVGRLLSILVLLVGGVTTLDTLGVPLSAVVALLGVVGLAVSLALQDILKNFFAGLYLLFERPFRLGDVVDVKSQRGVVETIGIRTTVLRTEDNVQVMIPNMTIFAEIVLNQTNIQPKTPEAEAEEKADPNPFS